MAYAIELLGLTKNYGTARGIEDLNLSVKKGQIFGFLGPNGAGKSTTINILLDFIRPTSGRVAIFNLDARSQAVQVHRQIGFLTGDMAMDAGLTGWQQLEYFGALRGSLDRSYVEVLAERLACDLTRKFKHLSRGNKQKVGLIAALMHKPNLLILDEPTSGLDPLIQAEFNAIILEHQKAGGTAFISSHVLSEVQEICDEVAFIREGRLVDIKTVSQLAQESPKRIRITSGTLSAIKKDLKGLPGLSFSSTKDELVGEFKGDVNVLIKSLSKHKLTDFSLEDIDLEESFMKYYQPKERQ